MLAEQFAVESVDGRGHGGGLGQDIHAVAILYLLLIPGLLLAAILVSLWCSKYSLTVSRYSVSSEKISHPFRVVQLTDLHNSLFGENNTRLVKRVTAEDPAYAPAIQVINWAYGSF